MSKLRASLSQIQQAGAQVIFIVPHERCRVKWWHDKVKGQFLVLADPGFWVSSMYGVAFQMRIHTDTSNTPGTFVIDKQGVLRWTHIGKGSKNWNDRPKPAQILAKVKEFAK